MTSEEMAAMWAESQMMHFIKEEIPPGDFAMEAFLAGFEAGRKLGFEKGIKAKVNTTTISDCPIRPVWHKVVDGDLPSVYMAVLNENGDKVEYTEEGKWQSYSEYYEGYVYIDTPIAWCEIPEYVKG